VLAEEIDGRADVYGFGVVLFRMLTGHVPFENHDETLLLAHQVLSTAPPPSWIAERVPPEVDTVVAAMLRKDPNNRYASMEKVCSDLRKLAGLEAGEASPPPIKRKPDRIHPKGQLGRQVAQVLEEKLLATE